MSRPRKLDDEARFYDIGMKLHWGSAYGPFRQSVVGQFGDFREKTILDYGCGTGLLLEYIKANFTYEGLYIACDPGARMLDEVRKKNISHPNIQLKLIPEIPALDIAPASVDIAVSSLVTHQLAPESKRRMFAELFRVLRPGGVLVAAEFGKSSGLSGRIGEFYIRRIWGKFVPAVEANSAENFAGAVPGIARDAGFAAVSVAARWKGLVDVIRAVKP